MAEPRVITNNVPRDVIYGYELGEEVREAEFNWMDRDTFEASSFFRYRGVVYALSEFMRCDDLPECSPLHRWDGHQSDSHFSAVVVRLVDDGERVVCGLYLA